MGITPKVGGAGKGKGAGAAPPKTKTQLFMVCVIRQSDEMLLASFKTSKDLDTADVEEIVSERADAMKKNPGKRFSEPSDEGITVHFAADSKGRVFAIMTKHTYPQRLAFTVLEELKVSFGAEFGKMVKGVTAVNGLSKECKELLKGFVDKYADPTQCGDALAAVQSKLDQATDTMKENIVIAIKNTEMLEDIEEQSEALEQKSKEFSKNAHALRQKYWWKKVKMYLMIGGIIAVLLIIIIVPIVVSQQAVSAASQGPNAASALAPPPPPPPPLPTAKPTKKPTKLVVV